MHRYAIFQAAQAITPNIIMFLPRNVDLHQVEELCWLSSPPLEFEVWFRVSLASCPLIYSAICEMVLCLIYFKHNYELHS